MRLRYAVFFAVMCAGLGKADDGAASIAAGGLVFRREPGITMAKEVLSISSTKVVVDYEFRNDTDAKIVTEVAFPVPPYRYGQWESRPKEEGFDDFKLAVEGKRMAFQTEVKAMVHGRDVSGILAQYHLDAATFSHADPLPDLNSLSPAHQRILIGKGILKRYRIGDTGSEIDPAWTVVKRYYWTQEFDARSVVHIHHEYTPVAGGQQMPSEYIFPRKMAGGKGMDADEKYLRKTVASFCLSRDAERGLAVKDRMYWFGWIDFILTSANTWRQPIEDFTLNIDRGDVKNAVSFCWDGPVEKVDATHFRAHAVNLIPVRELRIGFYQPLKF